MAEQTFLELTIEELGAAGDGVARHGNARYFIADCLPGDRVRVRITGRRGDGFAAQVIERIAEGPHRKPPACRHFNDCGGCAAQHFDDQIYDSWKRRRVIDALARRGLDGVHTDPDLTKAVAAALGAPRPDPGEARRHHSWGNRLDDLFSSLGRHFA
ncbi:MAG: TRAM domain-containing protein [Proteobacteria bacterium]|nr:TRAM domain-containing protein [Pseudomonadota bacterium]